jgi:hypothetical protein
MTFVGGWALVTEIDDQNPVIGDLKITGTRLATLATLPDRVAQSVRVAFKEWSGEWFLDRSRGMPYLTAILKKGVSESSVRAIVVKKILSIAGVARVTAINVSIDRSSRLCTVDGVEILTTDGQAATVGQVL